MAAERFKLVYADDSTEDVTRLPFHTVRAEAVVGANSGTMTYVYATLWAAATGGKGDRSKFEAWLKGLVDFDRIEDEGDGDADPPAQEPSGSPD